MIISCYSENPVLIADMGKALNFMLEFCGGYEKCRECDFKNACYYLSKVADEFVSIKGEYNNEG